MLRQMVKVNLAPFESIHVGVSSLLGSIVKFDDSTLFAPHVDMSR